MVMPFTANNWTEQWTKYFSEHLASAMLEIKELRCYEGKIEESEKASSHRELNPGHLWLEPPVLCYWATIAGQPPTLTILHKYCTGSKCLSCTPGSHTEDYEGWWLSDCHVSVQWQSTGGSSQRCPRFDSQQLPIDCVLYSPTGLVLVVSKHTR